MDAQKKKDAEGIGKKSIHVSSMAKSGITSPEMSVLHRSASRRRRSSISFLLSELRYHERLHFRTQIACPKGLPLFYSMWMWVYMWGVMGEVCAFSVCFRCLAEEEQNLWGGTGAGTNFSLERESIACLTLALHFLSFLRFLIFYLIFYVVAYLSLVEVEFGSLETAYFPPSFLGITD